MASGVEFRVNTTTANEQNYQTITGLSDGGFVVAWQSILQDGSSWGIYGQRYTSAGVASGVEFRVNTTTANEQYFPTITGLSGLSDGRFVLTRVFNGQGVLTWGAESATQTVRGSAFNFALLVTQRRHRDDLDLSAVGPDASRWLDIAQAFAGPPGVGRAAS